jgi:hypothetical protein
VSGGTLHQGDAWKELTLDQARLWLNDRLERAVRVEVFLAPVDEVAHAVITATGRLLHWRQRFPEAMTSDPSGAVAWYAIGSGEGEPANVIKTGFNLSRLPDEIRVVALHDRIDVELAEGSWLRVTQVTDALA